MVLSGGQVHCMLRIRDKRDQCLQADVLEKKHTFIIFIITQHVIYQYEYASYIS